MVEEKFSPIKNMKILAPKYNEMPFDEENLGEYWKIVPIKNHDEVIQKQAFLNSNYFSKLFFSH